MKKKCFLISNLLGFMMVALASAGSAYQYNKISIQPVQIFKNTDFSSVEKIVKYGDKYYVLEPANHRILVFDLLENHSFQISRIGQNLGELFYPIDFIIKGGFLYVHDFKNNRIQIFDLDGNFIRAFQDDHNSYGMAVSSREEIYLGQPERGKLVSVYDKSGRLIRSFGHLHKLSDFYGDNAKDMDNLIGKSINRVVMCLDDSDNLYLSFLGAPVFQKYDNQGNLIFEKRIDCPEAEAIVSQYREKKKSPLRRILDDIPLPLITTGIAINSTIDELVICFQWDRCWLYISDLTGNRRAVLEPIDKSMLFQNITSSENGDVIMARLSTVKDNEVYKVSLENFNERR